MVSIWNWLVQPEFLNCVCDFLTVAIPKREGPKFPVSRRGFQFVRHSNPNLTKALPPTFEAWALLCGGCSCGLCDGDPKLRGSGDSFAFRADAAEVLQAVAARNPRMFVYVHYYSGDISHEHLPPIGKERRKIGELAKGEKFRRDTLVEFVKEQG